MTRYCSRSVAAAQDWHSKFTLDQYCVREIEFWETNLDRLHLKSIIDSPFRPSKHVVYSDASATGCGAHLNVNGEQMFATQGYCENIPDHVKPNTKDLLTLLMKFKADSTVKRYTKEIVKFSRWCNLSSIQLSPPFFGFDCNCLPSMISLLHRQQQQRQEQNADEASPLLTTTTTRTKVDKARSSALMDNTSKIIIAVFCGFLGVVVCICFAVYRVYFQQVRVTLPDSSEYKPSPDQALLNYDSGRKRVFILHTRCCDKCSHVVHCFGTVLRSTDLIEPSIDMWNTLDISPNVPRWYEEQVIKSDRVIVLGSSKMSHRCQNCSEEGDDPLQIKCQLNFVRGNIAQNPDTRRFIPAFFTCNGSKKDIPSFLSDRWIHKLPKEVDRVIFRILDVERIQPHRYKPIVVMGGNGHPFDERKKEMEKAVQEAETYHCNNLQI
ncbi:uncharacterized protein [Montipora capricornis]|uniref:uncharacterized protein n=1 Tax=Montipora capricornis TaxID=246305 RepID=UPI0035F1F07D